MLGWLKYWNVLMIDDARKMEKTPCPKRTVSSKLKQAKKKGCFSRLKHFFSRMFHKKLSSKEAQSNLASIEHFSNPPPPQLSKNMNMSFSFVINPDSSKRNESDVCKDTRGQLSESHEPNLYQSNKSNQNANTFSNFQAPRSNNARQKDSDPHSRHDPQRFEHSRTRKSSDSESDLKPKLQKLLSLSKNMDFLKMFRTDKMVFQPCLLEQQSRFKLKYLISKHRMYSINGMDQIKKVYKKIILGTQEATDRNRILNAKINFEEKSQENLDEMTGNFDPLFMNEESISNKLSFLEFNFKLPEVVLADNRPKLVSYRKSLVQNQEKFGMSPDNSYQFKSQHFDIF